MIFINLRENAKIELLENLELYGIFARSLQLAVAS